MCFTDDLYVKPALLNEKVRCLALIWSLNVSIPSVGKGHARDLRTSELEGLIHLEFLRASVQRPPIIYLLNLS